MLAYEKKIILPKGNELPFILIIKKNNMKTTYLLILKMLCNTVNIIIAVSISSVFNNCRKQSFCSTAKKTKNKQTRSHAIRTRLENTIKQINFIISHSK